MGRRGYGPYNCYFCQMETNGARLLFGHVLATMRVFSGTGIYHGNGWAACDEHVNNAIEIALRPMVAPKCPPISDGWRVWARRVELDADGEPRMAGLIFTARARAAVPMEIAR